MMAFLWAFAVGITVWGVLFSRGHMFIGFVWMACAFVILEEEEEDVI